MAGAARHGPVRDRQSSRCFGRFRSCCRTPAEPAAVPANDGCGNPSRDIPFSNGHQRTELDDHAGCRSVRVPVGLDRLRRRDEPIWLLHWRTTPDERLKRPPGPGNDIGRRGLWGRGSSTKLKVQRRFRKRCLMKRSSAQEWPAFWPRLRYSTGLWGTEPSELTEPRPVGGRQLGQPVLVDRILVRRQRESDRL